MLAAGGVSAQIPATGFAIDRHTLAGISTTWVAVDATWSIGQRSVLETVGGRSYRELIGQANDGLPTNTIRQRFLGPLFASLRSWARTSIAAEDVARSAALPAPISEQCPPPPSPISARSAAPPALSSERPSPITQPGTHTNADTVVADFVSADRIVREIKSRVPYFQFCVNASRRRGGPELRRLVAVWSIAPDGTVKELKLEGVADIELATCIHRMGRRPLPVKPGVELTIPTPILFVR